MTTRVASHAGSWYSASSSTLSGQLDKWLSQVVKKSNGKELPIPGARVIIAPHAGYEYSGPTAAWAYQFLDLSNAKHIFLLGPSHVDALSGCALSTHSYYGTPMGNLKLDQDIIKELHKTKMFVKWNHNSEEEEHSLEMHLPYIYKMLSRNFKSVDDFPTLIPVLVGGTSAASECLYGQILAPYLAKSTSVFIVSSDFCHWGLRFSYTRYIPNTGKPTRLNFSHVPPIDPPIYKSIDRLDKQAMAAIEGGSHKDFLDNLRETGNTVCGRHPIGVIMAALEVLIQESRILAQESNISGQESDILGQESEISVQESDILGQESEISVQESDISGQESNISDQESYISSHESNISGQESNISSQESNISSEESNISDQESNISGPERGRFKFIQYKRNMEVKNIDESSVSYASAVAIL